jgi:ATP-dependent Lhr-like helicase
VHLGLASLLAWRRGTASEPQHLFSIAVNDYGFELLSADAGRLACAAAAGAALERRG